MTEREWEEAWRNRGTYIIRYNRKERDYRWEIYNPFWGDKYCVFQTKKEAQECFDREFINDRPNPAFLELYKI